MSTQGGSTEESSRPKAQIGKLRLGKSMATLYRSTELIEAQDPGVTNTHRDEQWKLLGESKTHKHAT